MGSTSDWVCLDCGRSGSPPYTWGALFHHCHYVWWQRITPIYMGSTHLMTGSSHWNGDHPHIHGEHDNGYPSSLDTWGSPPYTWGALEANVADNSGARITPIYMGSTRPPPPSWCNHWDHPHIHGEHFSPVSSNDALTGSPPYTWGAQANTLSSTITTGITPIYMGSTPQPV